MKSPENYKIRRNTEYSTYLLYIDHYYKMLIFLLKFSDHYNTHINQTHGPIVLTP